MAREFRQMIPAASAAVLVAALVLAPLGAVMIRAGGLSALSAADLAALRFTLWQAALSALFSCLLAIPLARALHRRRFPGRGLFIAALGAPFLLPTLVAVMGLLAIFGRRGLLNGALDALNLPGVSIYGPWGVVLGHLFLNLPLATRMLLQGWQAIPAERVRLALSLGLGPADIARHLEARMLRAVLPGAFLAIFLVCLSSFAVALTLGGGPRASTLEVAIYQAFRFDADPGRAAALAVLQVALALSALGIAARLTLPPGFGAGLDRVLPVPLAPGLPHRIGDALILSAAAAFLLSPLAAIALRGLPALADLPAQVWQAAFTSVWLALGAAALTMMLALPLALAAPRHIWAEPAAMLPMAASSLVLGTGLFLIAQPFVAPTALALPVTLLTNAALSLPFAVRLLLPEVRALQADYDRLAESLNLRGLARLRFLTLPRLARPTGFAAGIAAAFSMGDLGAIALFSDGRSQTLPLAVYQLMGSYRMDQAAGAACLLMALTFALYAACDRIGAHADPR
ncbi:thiamine/thiamine pyrophosphate ABC transporter permease ThiP [Rhodobacter capsulatus]|uniref:thiamine/thiamine pyrophosphate ABC transporter permease ThiP n=1 Tax=Rhodobacter capsulatus TaxID=1061 RepID=UPI0003D37DC4|nr:thiamine/thiamine pyrophosphate ABC transporter permease ThiP [Rhodobacter capsulatus]ETD82057.1 ABC transporter permease [Rhodobacter capsulatus YW1]